MSNEQNYTGIHVDNVVGTAGGDVQFKNFDNGNSVAELSIAVNQGYRNKQTNEWVETGTTWLRILASGDYADNNWPPVHKGDRVRVDGGRLETREFDRKDGTKGQAFEIRFGALSVVESKSNNDDPEKPF